MEKNVKLIVLIKQIANELCRVRKRKGVKRHGESKGWTSCLSCGLKPGVSGSTNMKPFTAGTETGFTSLVNAPREGALRGVSSSNPCSHTVNLL